MPAKNTHLNANLPIEARINALLAQMTLAEKIGQMTLVETGSITAAETRDHLIGGILTGGDGGPANPDTAHWRDFTSAYQQAALQTRLKIPTIYGIDAVHGHAKVVGATVFPHNIGLGATRNASLLTEIGRATAVEAAATGIWWVYAPVLAVPQDIRWGRIYEGYGQDPALVAELGTALFKGMQGDDLSDPLTVLATPKHFVGDGGTAWGSASTLDYQIDQGDTVLSEADLRRIHLAPYLPSIEAGALSIMVSFSSWNGVKLHAHKYLLTDVLKDELGFEGFLVSDWGGVYQAAEDRYQAVVTSINAGMDMNMVPFEFEQFIEDMTRAVDNGDIPLARVDDAVRRILRAKFAIGLFERPFPEDGWGAQVGCAAHRRLARQAVQQSLVLLQNRNAALPLRKDATRILVAGNGADNIGLQAGGWTVTWQGKPGPTTIGITILQGLRDMAGQSDVQYNPKGEFPPAAELAEVGIVFLSERPYAEGMGDREDLALSPDAAELIRKMNGLARKTVVVMLFGRPRLITDLLPLADAWVAAWLPGSEGQGVADVLFGEAAFTGKLPVAWPASGDQVPLGASSAAPPLFAAGFGLSGD